ncbi:MAG: hypothetical protein JSS27_09340 [Planctomycetes bacterium]|nr:hypothetical protein [Planctomycetota bacterium]
MVNIPLNDTVAAALSARAAAQGMTVEAYLECVLLAAPLRPTARLSVEELDRLLDAEATSGSSPAGTFARAELYSDHD